MTTPISANPPVAADNSSAPTDSQVSSVMAQVDNGEEETVVAATPVVGAFSSTDREEVILNASMINMDDHSSTAAATAAAATSTNLVNAIPIAPSQLLLPSANGEEIAVAVVPQSAASIIGGTNTGLDVSTVGRGNNEVDVAAAAIDIDTIPLASSQRLLSVLVNESSDSDEESQLTLRNNHCSEYTTISIFKPRKRTSVGLSFTDDVENDNNVLVDQISPDSPFFNTPLLQGDIVVSVNHVQAQSAAVCDRIIAAASQQWLTLTIHRPTTTSTNSNTVPVTVTQRQRIIKADHVTSFIHKRVPHQRLGIQFLVDPTDGALCVWHMDYTGLFAHTSLLKVADVVLSINGTYAANMPPETAIALLNDDPHQVILETRSEGGVVLVLSQRAPLPRRFYWICIGLVVLLILVMFAIFIFTRNPETNCQPFCDSLNRTKTEQAVPTAMTEP